MDDEFGEIGEDRIEPTERTPGILCDVARPEIGEPFLGNPISRRIDQPCLQILAFFLLFCRPLTISLRFCERCSKLFLNTVHDSP